MLTTTKSIAPIGSGLDGALPKEDWSYTLVIGIFLYLVDNSILNIAFKVHQCAQFNDITKEYREEAVKIIFQYLQGTRIEGVF